MSIIIATVRSSHLVNKYFHWIDTMTGELMIRRLKEIFDPIVRELAMLLRDIQEITILCTYSIPWPYTNIASKFHPISLYTVEELKFLNKQKFAENLQLC